MTATAQRSYLDWNATAPLRAESRAAMIAALDMGGNPSSVHREGRDAHRAIEDARDSVAALVGADPRNVIFTSGGTEANALALTPDLADAKGQARSGLVVSAIEHASVLAGGRFAKNDVNEATVDHDGVVDFPSLDRAMEQAGQRCLVSIHHANNETGAIQPIDAIARRVHAAGGLLHVDAVQTAGRIPLDINEVQADLVTVSAHKMGGPKGVGALVKRSADIRFAPLIAGGGQERGARAGTQNVAGIAGFGAAAAAARESMAHEAAHMAALRDRLETTLAHQSGGLGLRIFSTGVARLPNTTLFAVPGIKAETALVALDLDGVAVSSGSACSSGKVALSHVLAAMGIAPDLAACAIRISVGWTTTERDIECFIEAWTKLSERLSKRRQGLAA